MIITNLGERESASGTEEKNCNSKGCLSGNQKDDLKCTWCILQDRSIVHQEHWNLIFQAEKETKKEFFISAKIKEQIPLEGAPQVLF